MYIWCLHGEGAGGTSKADAVRKLSKGGRVKKQTGGRVSKNQKILQTSYVQSFPKTDLQGFCLSNTNIPPASQNRREAHMQKLLIETL